MRVEYSIFLKGFQYILYNHSVYIIYIIPCMYNGGRSYKSRYSKRSEYSFIKTYFIYSIVFLFNIK